MNFSEFLQTFYLPQEGGGLAGCMSKKSIPKFFFDNALDENYDDSIIPHGDDTYTSWFNNRRKPYPVVWAELSNHFDDNKLQEALQRSFIKQTIKTLAVSFGIALEVNEVPDKVKLANAITAQFRAIASGGGTAENIISSEYNKETEEIGYWTYLREATKKFNYMKLPGEGEYQLSDYFVCNNIGTSSVAFPHRIRGNYIENATLQKIRNFDKRGETRNVILVGACGYGKTLMLQHLFLEAANQSTKTGLIPFFAELRNYSNDQGNLVDFLVYTAKEFDKSFSKKKIEDLLNNGKAAILFDGLDELDPLETKNLQRRIGELIHQYPNNQVVISSRQCSAISGIRGFTCLYIHPLYDEQVTQLIDKLLKDEEDDQAKNTVISFIDGKQGIVKKNGFVATNPMLLTILVRNYEKFRDAKGKKTGFYDEMYNALIKGHDEDKESYDRFFHSVGNGEEFTNVFREFCALAYLEGVFEFDHRSFERFFKLLKCKSTLSNPSKFRLNEFQHDVCATACMMYEQESGIYYIDPGFQDYFFAEYYYFQDSEETKIMGKLLWNRDIDTFRNLDALKMLYELVPEKVNICILLPFLESVFRGKTDSEAFLRLLSLGYGNVNYCLLDDPLIQTYLKKPIKVEKFDYIPKANHVKNIVLAFLCDMLDLPNSFIIGSFETTLEQDDAKRFLVGFYDKYIDYNSPNLEEHDVLRALDYEIVHINDGQYFQDLEYDPFPLLDNHGCPVCFGFLYKVDPIELSNTPEKRDLFIDLCKQAKLDDIYTDIKDFYSEIIEKQKANKIN